MTTAFNDTCTEQLATITGPDLQQVTGGEAKATTSWMSTHANDAKDCVGKSWNYANSLGLGADFTPAQRDGSMSGRLLGIDKGTPSDVRGHIFYDPKQMNCRVDEL